MVKCDPNKPLTNRLLRKAIGVCLTTGSLVFSGHALRRMVERNIIDTDVVNVLESGQIQSDPDWEKWHWRYRVETQNFAVVVTFEPDEGEIKEMIIVTAFKNRRRTK